MTAWPHASGEMSHRIRTYDWAATPLGPIEQWPQSRKTAVDLMLASGHAMQMAWGPERTVLYNDAYTPMLGDHHPRALGLPFREAWPDIWDEIRPLVDRVFAGETVRFEDMPLVMMRRGYAEETWWNFSYSPVRDESGAVAGLLNVTVDVTAKHRAVQAERERDAANALLLQNEARFRALVTAGANAIYRMSPDWRLLYELDSETLTSTTAPIEDWVGKYILEEDLPTVHHAIDAAIRTKSLFELEHRARLADGSVGWVLSRAVPLLGPDGEITEWFGVGSDVTGRKRIEHELREADRRKDEFLAMLGHELRNPLAPLSNVIAVLRRPNLGQATLDQAHALMERQVDHLSRLVNDLLDVSRITLGLIELRKHSIDLTDVAKQAVEMAMPAMEGGGHELTLALPRRPLLVHGDAARLTQVILNLLNNASKFTPDGGRIWLTLEREHGQAALHVRDNGSGMTSDLVPRVFELFMQGARTLDRSQGGLGLGLTLVKRLVEMHGGTVEASSEGPGRGSEFIVRLPVLAAAPQTKIDADPARPTAERTAGVALVVDDVPDIADSYLWLFEGLIEEVHIAHSGEQALELAGRRRPSLIVCDLGMPGMDGYETCRRLRQLPGMKTAVIAAVSGYGGDEYVRASQEAGFDCHLVKPLNRATLEGLVQSLADR